MPWLDWCETKMHLAGYPEPVVMLKSVLLSLCLAATFCVAAQHRSNNRRLEKELHAAIKEWSAVGLSVVAVKEGNIVYKQHFGYQDKEKKIPLNDQTIFRIASISKSFSATAIMQLIDEGKLSLDDDFGKLLGFAVRNPKYPDKVITLRMVMSHTSGVNDSQGYFNLDVINPSRNPDWAKCYSDYEPGAHYDYCNLNFNMVGAVLERQTGVRLDAHIRNKIIKPLGLYGGHCVDSLDATRFATLYAYDSTRSMFVVSPEAYAPRREALAHYELGYTTPVLSPTGGMKISAIDLARYMMMHMYDGTYHGVRIMSAESARLMRQPIADQEGYGLAMRETSDVIDGVTLKGHTGTAYGLYSAMFFDPEKKFGFVVITNGCLPDNSPDIRPLLRKSMAILYKHIIDTDFGSSVIE